MDSNEEFRRFLVWLHKNTLGWAGQSDIDLTNWGRILPRLAVRALRQLVLNDGRNFFYPLELVSGGDFSTSVVLARTTIAFGPRVNEPPLGDASRGIPAHPVSSDSDYRAVA